MATQTGTVNDYKRLQALTLIKYEFRDFCV